MFTDRDSRDDDKESLTQRALRLAERKTVTCRTMNTDRHREAHGVQQEGTAATSTLAHVQFAVASLMAPVFELPLSVLHDVK